MSTVTDLTGLIAPVVAGGVVVDFAERTFDTEARKRRVNKTKKRKKKVKRTSGKMTVLGLEI